LAAWLLLQQVQGDLLSSLVPVAQRLLQTVSQQKLQLTALQTQQQSQQRPQHDQQRPQLHQQQDSMARSGQSLVAALLQPLAPRLSVLQARSALLVVATSQLRLLLTVSQQRLQQLTAR
jgi:hypothetical protein